jgi:hypothetical protein
VSKENQIKGYVEGPFESSKFSAARANYKNSLDVIKSLEYEFEDYIQYFPCFTGHLTLARYLSFYEFYRRTLGVAGHIAEVGVYKGAVSLFFAKLIKIYESNSLTQVHGFDWFKGNLPGPNDLNMPAGGYSESYERVSKLIEAQGLDNIFKLHNLDVVTEIIPFLGKWKHMQFKIVFLDCGAHEVVRTALPALWERLTPGGILILDQYNFDVAPGETLAVREFLPNANVRTLENGWMPTAFIEKG